MNYLWCDWIEIVIVVVDFVAIPIVIEMSVEIFVKAVIEKLSIVIFVEIM
jgi:hypothetical protein